MARRTVESEIERVARDANAEARVEAQDDAIRVEFWREKRKVGVFRASQSSMPDWRVAMMPPDCAAAWGDLGQPPLWVVASAEWFAPSLQQRGLGLRMYGVLLSVAVANGGVLAPDSCIGGSTSPAARRVWQKLYTMYPHHGPLLTGV